MDQATDEAPNFEPCLSPRRAGRPGTSATTATAFAAIRDGARVLVPPSCGTPLGLLEALDEARGRWSSLTLISGLLVAPIAPAKHAGEPFRFITTHPNRYTLATTNGGFADAAFVRYGDTIEALRPGNSLAPDVVVVQVSAPGPEGRFSLGASVGTVADAVRTAPLVIAQVNPQVPYTFGAGEFARDEFDFLVDMEGPVPEQPSVAITAEAEAVAANVLAIIPDEATVQFGIGAIPDAILTRLPERRDLGIHSGMIADGIIELAASGALTGAKKAFDQGWIVTAELIGTRRLFDWAHRNPLLRMAPATYTHGVTVASRCSKLVALQGALEIGLDGTVNAEQVGEAQMSGCGGQPEFAEAALLSVGGIGIHALPATAAGGKLSRIVRTAAGATTPRYLTDCVVTEYGVAELRGKTASERAAALRAIAHPDFRAALG